jgi:ABC-type Mn2+/Zn2+ transport system permease subunit
MENLYSSLELFLPQIMIGVLLGGVLSTLGVIIVLRNLSFFGVTISGVSATSLALCLSIGIQNEIWILLLSSLIIIPISFYSAKKEKSDIFLGIVFVSSGSLSQLLITLGGNVQNHLLQSYFGDILTSQIELDSPGIYLIILCILSFTLFYRKILFYSFDKNEYLSKYSSTIVDLIFFTIITIVISYSVRILGSFYSVAQLLIPAFTSLILFKSLGSVFLFSIFFSIIGTILGFLISLNGFVYHNELIYFPTSSLVVVFLTMFSIILILCKKYCFKNSA